MIIENGDEYIAEVRELIIEYTNRLNRDLSFQGLDDELNSLEDNTFERLDTLISIEIPYNITYIGRI